MREEVIQVTTKIGTAITKNMKIKKIEGE